jgi:F-type H+-transporting ATPase subunit delta
LRSVAREYAGALADVVLASGRADALRQEVRAAADLAAESPDLRNFLSSPAIPREGKHALVEKLVARMGASQELRNFLFVLVDHHRTAMLGEIAREFETTLLDRLGVVQASVTSARELSAPQKQKLAGRLEGLTGKKIEAQYAVDPTLVGGLAVRIGSTVYDGSVRAQLDRLAARLPRD